MLQSLEAEADPLLRLRESGLVRLAARAPQMNARQLATLADLAEMIIASERAEDAGRRQPSARAPKPAPYPRLARPPSTPGPRGASSTGSYATPSAPSPRRPARRRSCTRCAPRSARSSTARSG
ncbi:hypothetical protein [Streptomyces canarius]